jgi:hypothetical protein
MATINASPPNINGNGINMAIKLHADVKNRAGWVCGVWDMVSVSTSIQMYFTNI